MLVVLGCAVDGRGLPPNCTGEATSLKGTPSAVSQSCMYPLAMLCGSTAHSSVSCTTHHCPVKSARRSRHSATVCSAKADSRSFCPSRLFSIRPAWSAKRGSVRQFGVPDHHRELGPVPAGLETAEGQGPTVLGRVVAHERIQPRCVGRRPSPRGVAHQRQREGLAHGPHAGAEQRDVDRGGLARPLPMEQRAHDAAGDRHGPDGVTETRPGRSRQPIGIGRLHPHGDAGPEPERERVVGALVGVGATLALPRARHVDDVRVVRPDVIGLDRRASCAPAGACW